MKEFVIGNIRIQVLCEEIIRLELAKKGKFCDADTFFIPDKGQFKDTLTKANCGDNRVDVGEYAIIIPENCKGLKDVYVEKNGVKVYTYKRIKNSGELPPFNKTPEVFAVSDCPRIIFPDGGYTYRGEIENSGYIIEESVQDIYLLLCGKDFKKLRRLFVELTGRNEFVRLSVFGGWNSKYYPYTQDEAKQLILDYETHNVPLDIMVIDTDWRSSENGWGYDINTKLFPDMKEFLEFAHSHGVEIMFNDHPEPVEGANIFEPKEIKYREDNLQRILDLGLDIWWYDRNWHTKLVSPVKGIEPETLGMYVFSEITKHFNQKKSGDENNYTRPVIMANVNNVLNGKYATISDSASHRYSVQWTGDTQSDFDALKQDIENLIKCSNNCIAYVNSDCGGHLGNPDKEQFIRWMQFGLFSPVFRPHRCPDRHPREPWGYDEETLDIVREFNNLRYRLLPVIYKCAYENYLTGEPIFKSLAWNYSNDRRALKCADEYMLGNDILIAPIYNYGNEGAKNIYLPQGNWIDAFSGKIYSGGKSIKRNYKLNEMPLFIRSGALIPLAYNSKNTKEQTWDRLVFDLYPDKDFSDKGYIYEDDTKSTAYKYGECVKSAYSAYYCEECNAFVVKLFAAKGNFEGARNIKTRSVIIKYHLLSNANDVAHITINGEEHSFGKLLKDGSVFVLNAGETASESNVVTVAIDINVNEYNEIKFYL